jgi:Cof subfamily protein (haloacid dehalogenase superfamily)
MNRIALVVSDVDGTLLTKDKTLTGAAKAAVRELHDAGIGFTVTSSRPTIGMRLFVEPLGLTLPIGAFNGSCIVDRELQPIEQHLIPEAVAGKTIDLLGQFDVDVWLFTGDRWFTRDPNGPYVPLEKRAIRAEPSVIADFSPHLASACKIVGSSADPELLERCEAAAQESLGTQATAVRSQSYYLDITPPGYDKGTFVQFMARRLAISTEAIATIGDMHNDLAMFRHSGMSFAMGNATDDVKRAASHVTASNEEEGFAKAMKMILSQ